MGSIPVGVTKTKRQDLCLSFCFVIPMCRANPLVRPSIDVQSLTGEDIVAQAEMLPVGVLDVARVRSTSVAGALAKVKAPSYVCII